MILFHELAFDEVISGTTGAWYTPVRLQAPMGAADGFAFQACTTLVSGGPTLTITAEHSADAEAWLPLASFANAVANDGSYYGSADPINLGFMSFLRFKFSLTGATPQCRVKLYVTGRVWGASAPPVGAHPGTAAQRSQWMSR